MLARVKDGQNASSNLRGEEGQEAHGNCHSRQGLNKEGSQTSSHAKRPGGQTRALGKILDSVIGLGLDRKESFSLDLGKGRRRKFLIGGKWEGGGSQVH